MPEFSPFRSIPFLFFNRSVINHQVRPAVNEPVAHQFQLVNSHLFFPWSSPFFPYQPLSPWKKPKVTQRHIIASPPPFLNFAPILDMHQSSEIKVPLGSCHWLAITLSRRMSRWIPCSPRSTCLLSPQLPKQETRMSTLGTLHPSSRNLTYDAPGVLKNGGLIKQSIIIVLRPIPNPAISLDASYLSHPIVPIPRLPN